jgi:hypothetical protein
MSLPVEAIIRAIRVIRGSEMVTYNAKTVKNLTTDDTDKTDSE